MVGQRWVCVSTNASHTHNLPQQGEEDTVADVNLTNKTVIIGTVNVGRAVRPFADRVHVDPAANISVAKSGEGMVDRRKAPEGTVILMNSHPAPVTEFGTMRVQVQDAKTDGAVEEAGVEKCCCVPNERVRVVGMVGTCKEH